VEKETDTQLVGCKIPKFWIDRARTFQKTENGEASLAAFYRAAIRARLIETGMLKADAA
jgi:hypothetical protein